MLSVIPAVSHASCVDDSQGSVRVASFGSGESFAVQAFFFIIEKK